MYSDPKDFLKALMNDPGEDMKLRMEAAKTLMPFTHGKVADQGKKEAKQEEAEQAVSSAEQGSGGQWPCRRACGTNSQAMPTILAGRFKSGAMARSWPESSVTGLKSVPTPPAPPWIS